ncbi:MAG: Methyltransferase domain protein [Deltaproteobacteria bacterium]|nr:Methyltransferase domain protein [Deltaproteobacteria bacterium]
MEQPRPALAERTAYQSQWPAEDFMVPVLRRMIESGIDRYARAAPPDARALDVGCGGQPFRRVLEAMGYRYIGFDALQNPAGTVDVVGAIDEPLPPQLDAQGPFHFILCTEVLEHVARWHVAFANLARLLSPGGRLLITCPHFYPPHEEPYDFWRPTIHAVDWYAREVGLKPLEVRRGGDAADILGTMLAVTRIRAARPRFSDHVLAAVSQLVRRCVAAALRTPWVRQRLVMKGPLYLSLFAVLEKQPS